ncbi:lipid A deacylase LpxR family protein [Spirosoma utsteinense]|uniref:Lipid A deacylase LpxR family protein n=2 Tax=Spirosoma utsteinense TaxID=2585773 RepID=A0ABR6W0F1_9BACT|nr:lipid A deacylase LpxR family protein [Spirosoma utsteinense]MBC3789566.1 hypothetical protein [Spirosoma utsteinense]
MMQTITRCLALVGCLVSGFGSAQRIDNTALFRQMGQASFIRLHYHNDLFTGTDYYYTQGYSIEAVRAGLQKNPLTRLLVKSRVGQNQYGLAFEHFGFTPTSIQRDAIPVGDRPFAGCILVKTFSMSVDTLRRVRVSSVLSTGMIGPVALGGPIQTALHRLTNGVEPHGWQHQIRNDVIVNYTLAYDQQLYAYRRLVLVSASVQAQAGTFANRLQTGIVVMAGRFDSPFAARTRRRLPMQVYVFAQPLIGLVAYDASLQGGLFNRSSPYVIQANQLARTTVQVNLGAVFRYKNLYLEYDQSTLSREFVTGRPHRWGGVKIGVSFSPLTPQAITE